MDKVKGELNNERLNFEICFWFNQKSALIGGISGVILMSWISLQAQFAIASGDMDFPPKKLEADQCNYTFQPVNSTISDGPKEEFHSIYKISYMWYVLGAVH